MTATVEQVSPLTPDPAFAQPANRATLESVAEAARKRGIAATVVATGADARALVHEIIPDGAHVFDATSRTLEAIGIAEDILKAERYDAARTVLNTLNPATDMDQYRRGVASPSVVVGSVHAVTRDGQLVIASASGSQLAAYAFGASTAVWVVGAQKIVADLDQALERIQRYSYPLEDARTRVTYGVPSAVNKQLIISGETPGRAHLILVEEVLGF